MPIEIICGACGAVQYSGFDLKSPKEIIRANGNKCKSCGKTLSNNEFGVDIIKS